MPPFTLLITVGCTVGAAVALLWLVKSWFRSMVAAACARLDGITGARRARRRDDRANCFGLRSGSVLQLRGNGVLALYDTELIFVQLMVDRVIRIRLDAITSVTTTRAFRGKTIFRDLLAVSWSTAGSGETAAWFVADLPGWLADLRRGAPVAAAASGH